MIKNLLLFFVLSLTISGCVTTKIPHQAGVDRVSNNTTYVAADTNRIEFERQVSEVINNRNNMIQEQAFLLDKRNKPQVRGFMEQTKVSMQLCQSAIDTQNLVKETLLIACEPFFRDLEMARFGTNEKTLRNYGMGAKIALALAAGAAGAAMHNSNNWGTIISSGAVMVTAARIASIPNDWQVISPYMSKVEANAYNKWLVLHINEQQTLR